MAQLAGDGLIGSAAVVVLSDKDDLAAVARNLMSFFTGEGSNT